MLTTRTLGPTKLSHTSCHLSHLQQHKQAFLLDQEALALAFKMSQDVTYHIAKPLVYVLCLGLKKGSSRFGILWKQSHAPCKQFHTPSKALASPG